MSELTIKRSKIAKQLSKQQRLNYFKIRRNEMLAQREDIQEEGFISRQTDWLKQIANRSIITNQLLEDIRKNSLIKTLQYIAFSTMKGRDIEIILIILSNALLDSLTLDDKESIVKLCISCYQIKVFDQYSSSAKDWNLNCMLTITHNLNSLSRVVNYVEEELGVKCQDCILREVIKILYQLKGCIKHINQKDQKEGLELIQKLTNALNGLIYFQKEYANQLYSRFQRHSSSFYQILKLHASFVFMNFYNPLIRHLHLRMLDIQQYLTSSISLNNFQVYFESTELISIILKEIYQNRDQLLNKRALNVLNNLLRQYQSSEVIVLMSLIEADIHLTDKFIFFSKLLYKDTLKRQRMRIIEHFLSNNDSYSVFQPFYESYWRGIVDSCCEILQQQSNQSGLQALNILIEGRCKYFEGYTYQSYLRSIGMYNLLNQKCRNYQQTTISEEFYSKISLLLTFLKQQEYVI